MTPTWPGSISGSAATTPSAAMHVVALAVEAGEELRVVFVRAELGRAPPRARRRRANCRSRAGAAGTRRCPTTSATPPCPGRLTSSVPLSMPLPWLHDEARKRSLARRQEEIADEPQATAFEGDLARHDRMIGECRSRASRSAARRRLRRGCGGESARGRRSCRRARRRRRGSRRGPRDRRPAPRRRGSCIPRRRRANPASLAAVFVKMRPEGRPMSRRTAFALRRISSARSARPGLAKYCVRSMIIASQLGKWQRT